MILGEALALRADLKKRAAEIKGRINANARVQEGEAPSFSIPELIVQFEAASDEYCSIIKRINRTNSATKFDDATLADAIIERDRIRMMQTFFQDLASASGESQHRHLRSELRTVAQVKGAEAQARADRLGKERRELDVRIQAANWSTHLHE